VSQRKLKDSDVTITQINYYAMVKRKKKKLYNSIGMTMHCYM